MRPLKHAINVTLDGCCDHQAGPVPDAESHAYWAAQMEQADALILGRVTYQMMEEAWRRPASGTWPDWIDDELLPFAEAIDGAQRYVVSNTLDRVDWNAELLQGDLGDAVRSLKEQAGNASTSAASPSPVPWPTSP